MRGLRTIVRQLGVVGGLGLLGTCRSGEEQSTEPEAASRPAEPAALRGWHYDVSVDASLERADVHLCFSGRAPARLIPGLRDADPHGHDFRETDGEPLPRAGLGQSLEALGEDACVDYWVDLGGLERSGVGGRMVGRTGESLMIRPSLWMWRPERLPDGVEATLRFTLPPGVQASVPWPTVGGSARTDPSATYRLERTAFDWLSYASFGVLTIDRFEHAGAEVELVTLDAPLECPPEGLRTWARAAMDAVALLFDGRFPRDHLQMVVLPVEGDGGGTEYFGMAGRGGGPGIYVFLDDHAQAERLPGGWTTVHEMLHHGMPFIDEPWMAEGWVTYYTELMRTRAGFRREQAGWRAMVEGFGRGRRTRGMTLEEASARMGELRVYQRVYWGGAAVALLIDVQMRLETDGARSLDDAMKELRRCCGDADHQWPARELLEQLDAWYGRPLFTQTADAVLAQPELPDVEAALDRVGVHVEGDRIRLDEDPAKARHRRAMMAPRTDGSDDAATRSP